MRRSVTASAKVLSLLAVASLACFALPSVSHFPVYQITPTSAETNAPDQDSPQTSDMADAQNSSASGVETVYGDNSTQSQAGLPQIVLAGMRAPAEAGMPSIEYGDASAQRVHEIGLGLLTTEALPVTAYAGDAARPEAGMPEIVTGSVKMPRSAWRAAGMPETAYGETEEDKPVNEAVGLAEQAANPNGEEVETPAGFPPEATASPYSKYTDAQRVGMNPCEMKDQQPQPSSPLTMAQQAGQTNCW
jgi:hypothetical protein